MKFQSYFILGFILIHSFSYSQSIRKHFTEMTASEKSELQNAWYQMRDINGDGATVEDGDPNPEDDDLAFDLALFHNDFFNFNGSGDTDPANDDDLDIHFNLPDQDEIQIFFSWHRYQMFEMEQALQNVNPKVSLGYWDSSIYQDSTFLANNLFSPDLLGPFDTDWGLNRDINRAPGALPTPAEVSQVMGYSLFTGSVFNTFSNRMEREEPHTGAHIWTGGFMPTPLSPADPVFYFHHSWVDKLWVDWEDALPGYQSSFIIQSMIRYDGTYVFNGNTLPLINPNDYLDTRSLGVFYAENGLVELDNYTVSNTHKPVENFYYQFTIEVGNNFTAANGTTSEIESVNEVVLEPGFFAESGSNFLAKIDSDNNINTASRPTESSSRYNPFRFSGDIPNDVYEDKEILGIDDEIQNSIKNMQFYPNPFNEKFTLNFQNVIYEGLIEIYDTNGKMVYSKSFKNTDKIIIEDLKHISSGVYILNVFADNGESYRTNILKR